MMGDVHAGLRAVDVALVCLTCRGTIVMPGPWHGERIAAWSALHRRPMLASWSVTTGPGEFSQRLTVHLPPLVLERPPGT